MTRLIQLNDRLERIAFELEKCYAEFHDLAAECDGPDFEGRARIIGRIEDAIVATTHETATEIGFSLDLLDELGKFFAFRADHFKISDENLEQLIDDENLTLPEKVAIMGNNDVKAAKLIQSEWNRLFNNQAYKTVKSKLGLRDVM